MPTSIRATSDPRSNGFTLVELMVVVALMALASAVVVVSLPDPRASVNEDIDRFAARVSAARDAAVVEARPMSVWVTPSGYGFARRVAGQWVPLDDKPFVTTDWRNGAVAELGDLGTTRIVFDSTGAALAPLVLTLTRGDRHARASVGSDGRVTVGRWP